MTEFHSVLEARLAVIEAMDGEIESARRRVAGAKEMLGDVLGFDRVRIILCDGFVAVAEGEVPQARRCLEEAEEIRSRFGATDRSEVGQMAAQLRSALNDLME